VVRETLEALQQDNLLSKVPVIMVSSDENKGEKCFEAGCSDFLVKPVDLTHLHISLQKCLPNRSGMRKHIRAPLNRNVSFTFAGLEIKSFAITLSEGGIYLRTNKPLPIGSKVEVKVPLETGAEIMVKGEVAYTMGLLRGQFLVPPGIAIRFVDLSESDQENLRQEVSHLLIGDMIDKEEDAVFRSTDES
jgi:type IV pilus assembly protein PilZ